MTQQEFDRLATHVKHGGTLYIHLATRIIKVDPKCWRRWMDSGRPVLKLGDLFVDIIDLFSGIFDCHGSISLYYWV